MSDNSLAFPFPPDVSREWWWSASWWDLLRAKLFGERHDDISGPYRMTAYYWRGTLYITSYRGFS